MKKLLLILIFCWFTMPLILAQDLTVVSSSPASLIGSNSATFNGTLESNAILLDVKYQFRYGTTSGDYDQNTAYKVVNVAGEEDVSEELLTLDPANEYFYVLYGENNDDPSNNFTSSERSFFTLANVPSASVSAITLNTRTYNSASFTFPPYDFSVDGGNGGYVLYKSEGTSPIDLSILENAKNPDDQDAALSDNDVWETDEDQDNITFASLDDAKQYTMTLVSYNSDGSTDATVHYRKSDPPSTTFWTLSNPPDGIANLNAESGITANTVDLDWNDVTNANRYLVMYSQDQAALDITDVQDGDAPGDLNFPTEVEFVNTTNTNSDIALSSLQPDRTYYYYVIPYAQGNDPSTINYITQTAPELGTFETSCIDPTETVSNLQLVDVNSSEIELSWDAPDSLRILVVARPSSEAAVAPTASETYNGNSDFSSANQITPDSENYVVHNGDGSSTGVTVTNLLDFEEYTFDVYLFNDNGKCYGDADSSISPKTDCKPANEIVSNQRSDNVDINQLEIKWDRSSSDVEVLVVAREQGTIAETPSINTEYNVNNAFGFGGASAQTGSGNFVVYAGGGNTVTITDLDANTAYEFDLYEYTPKGFCYNSIGRTVAESTECAPPDEQAQFNTIDEADISPLAIDISWNSVDGATDYLVVARRNSPVNFEPTVGDAPPLEEDVNSDFSNTVQVSGGGNNAVYVGGGNSVTVSGLDLETQYHFAVFAYNLDGYCYVDPTNPGEANATTKGAASNNTVELNSPSPATINSVANDNSGGDFIAVLDFNVMEGGTDEVDTNIDFITFSRSVNDYFEIQNISWDEIIAEARLENMSNSETLDGIINTDNITIDIPNNSNDDSNDIGFVGDGNSINFQLKIRLKDNITVADIDNKNLVFDLLPADIVTESNSSSFDVNSSTISSGDANNQIIVEATEFNFIEPSANVEINATENFNTVPEVEVKDANGNLDLDYESGYSLSNQDGINVNNPPGNFSNGKLLFPPNFNYQRSGNGTLSIIDESNSIANSTSNEIIVNPKIIFSEITETFNTSVLESGELNEVVLGFDLIALNSATLEAFTINIDQTLADRVSNVRLFSSSDNLFDGADTEVSTGIIDDGANTITFSPLSEAINELPSNYFVVVEVDESVSGTDPDVTFSFDESNFSFVGNFLIEANSIAETYSFKDVIAPEVVSISAQPAFLADADASPGDDAFQIIIEYNEEMDTDPLKEPEISFPTEDPTSSLTFSPLSSGWDVDGLIYTATYNFSDENITLKDIDVNVASAEDLSDNTQVEEEEADLFSIDTENPTPTLSLNRTLVNVPQNSITLTAEFNELMDTSTDPDITVSQPANFDDNNSGEWDLDKKTYTITFTHNQNEEFKEDVFFQISNAKDTAGNTSVTEDSEFFEINTVLPKIEAITSSNNSDTYKEGDGPIEITLDYDQTITLDGLDEPQLTLNAGIATYSGIVDDKITFSYNIADGDNADPLEVTALNLNGAVIENAIENPIDPDLLGNALSDDKTIIIDTKSPEVISITSDTPDGIYGPGDEINFKVTFDEDIVLTGTPNPELNLNASADAVAAFVDITNGKELNFTYTVGEIGSNQNTDNLAITIFSPSENEILDVVGNPSDLTLDGTNNTFQADRAIEIDTEVPELAADPFFPAQGSLNVSQSETFTITLNETVSGAGTDNIKLVEASSGDVLATLDGSAAFANSDATTLNFNSLSSLLQDSTEYYFEFDEGAIVDVVGNPLASFTGAANWSFTTFGPARIEEFPDIAACVDDSFIIKGKFFTGVSQVLTDVEGGSSFEIIDFDVLNDSTISFIVPEGTIPGKITLNKIDEEDGNTADATTTSEEAIKVGASSAEIVLVNPGTGFVCDEVGSDGAPVETKIRFDIVGGSGTYTIEYSNGDRVITEPGYTTGKELDVDPPLAEENVYSIISIKDADDDLSACELTDDSKFTDLTIVEYEQSQVEAGGTFDSDLGVSTVSVCLAEEDQLDLSDVNLMGTLPLIEGDIEDGEWTIVDGPNSGGGGFSSNFNAKTSTDLRPTYYPSLADASYGSVTLRLTSDDPAGPNPCSTDWDEITIVFENTVSVNVGPDLNACIETDEDGNKSVIQEVNATLGGGAAGLEWTRVDNTNESASHDGSWGFAASADATNFSLTSTLEDPFYKASPQEIATNNATLKVETTGGGCGGAQPASRELEINISELPTPERSLIPTDVCSGEEGVRYRMSPTSTQNIFEWSLTNEGIDSSGENDKNQIDGNDNSNLLIVNFRDVDVETTETLIVKEINPLTGCESIPDTILISLKPTPQARITYNETTTLSQGDDRILLTGEGGQTGNIQEGGEFSGPGVVMDQSGNYYLDPSNLDVTNLSDPSDDVVITFTYYDEFGCSATDTKRFNIYAENTVFQNLLSEYCVEDIQDSIFVTPIIIEDGFEVIGISGPGITEIGLEDEEIDGTTTQVFKATFNPALAYEDTQNASNPSQIEITFSTREISNPNNIREFAGFQRITVNPLPNLEFEGPEYDLCTYDEPADLEAVGNNNLNTYEFSLVRDDLPGNLIDGDSIDGFEFDPFPLDDYLRSRGEESIEIEMEYRYTNAGGCSDSEIFSFIVYRQPDSPQLEEVNLCNIDGEISEAVITNYDGNQANLELEWYANSSLSGDPIAFGESYQPGNEFFINNDSVKFYVVRKNNNSSGEDDELCSSNATEVTYRVLGVPELSWNKSSFGSSPVVFIASHNEINVQDYFWEISRITSDGLESVLTETVTDLDNQQLSVDFENYGAGQYQVDFIINSKFNCATPISDKFLILPENSSTSSFSYDFEESNQGWVGSIDDNNSWEWNSSVDSSSIQTDGAFWITNASGSYNPGEQSYVYSPVLDLSQIDKPVVNFDLWVDVINNVDGLILEYSTDDLIIEDPEKQWQLLGNFDGGNSSGLNWYESTGIRSRPGTENLTPDGVVNNNIFGQGWSREADSIATKLQAKHALEIAQSERSNVIFRFQFKSNTTGFLPDGVAFDNFRVESLNRNVLVEYFGDDADPADGQEMESISNEFNNSSSFSWINYRISEEDPLFKQNASAMLSRIYQYDAYSGSNNFAIDGVMKTEYSFSTDAGRNDLSNSLLASSIVDIDLKAEKITEDQLGISVEYNSTSVMPENARLFVAVLQKEIRDGDLETKTDKVYFNVLRKLLPDVEGINISNGSTGQIELDFKANRESDAGDLIIVSFIQDVETGEIYQSASIMDVPDLTYSEVTANTTLEEIGIQLYPNPAREKLNLSFGSQLTEDVELKVVDLAGKVIEERKLEKGAINYELNTKRLNSGIYNLLITNKKGDHKMVKFAVTN